MNPELTRMVVLFWTGWKTRFEERPTAGIRGGASGVRGSDL